MKMDRPTLTSQETAPKDDRQRYSIPIYNVKSQEGVDIIKKGADQKVLKCFDFFFRILKFERPGQTASFLRSQNGAYESVKLREHRNISLLLSFFEFSTIPFFNFSGA